MNQRNKLALILNINPGEGRLIGLLFMLYFFMGGAYSFTQASAFPLFLLTFSSRDLPWVYMTNALVVVVITFVYLRLSKRLSFTKLLSGNILFLFLVITSFRFGLGMTSNRWVIFGLPVLFQILINFGNLAFWSLAGRLLHVRQAKRLFGLIGGGQWAAIVLTGFLIPSIVAGIGIRNLLILAAVSMLFVFAILTTVTRIYAGQLKTLETGTAHAASRPTSPTPLKRYLGSIFSLVILSYVAYYFIDNIFYGQLAIQYADEEQLAGFMGFYLAGQALLILFINTFLTGPILNRFGVRLGLLILPLGLIAITASSAVLGTLLNAAGILFMLAVLSKLAIMAMGFSFDLVAVNVIYQPLPPQQRARAKTMADGIVQPLANGLAGLALLLLTSVLALEMVQLSYILLFILAGWLIVVMLLNREYPAMLRKALTKRQLGGADLSIADETSVSVLIQELQNPHPGVVLYALNTLETVEQEPLRRAIPSLLEHPSTEVRQEILECIERQQMTAALDMVRERVQSESIPAVRGAALRTLSALGGPDSADTLVPFVHDANPHIRMGAIVGLIRNCGIEGVLAAGNMLLEMSKADSPEQRRLAAQIIGELGTSSFYDPLIPLLSDEQREVRRAAIQAAGQVKNPNLIPQVASALKEPALRGPASAVLVSWGEAVLSELFHSFDIADQDQETITALIDVIGRIGGAQGEAWLKGKLADPAAPIRTQVMRSLNRCGYRAQDDEKDGIQEQIRSEAAFAANTLALIADLGENEAAALFLDSLHNTLNQIQARIFDLLSFLYDPQAIHDARANLTLARDDRRAYALEVLDVVVSKPIKTWVDPLWSDGPALQKVQQLKALIPTPHTDLEQCLREILTEREARYSIWCKACALYTIATLSLSALSDCVQQALTSPHPLLRETAIWTLVKLEVTIDKDLIRSLHQDSHPQVARAAELLNLAERAEGAITMLTTLEKVIALKKASIFSTLPNEILAAVAPLLEEIWFDDGTTAIVKGELGDCMYIIVQGKVRVHDEDLTLNFLEEGDVFGEMAVLDSEPRVASVTAVEETCLLRLAQEPLYELMDVQPEVAQGLIRTLSRHLRDRIQDLNAIRSEIGARQGRGNSIDV